MQDAAILPANISSLLVYFAAVLAVTGIMLGAAYALGPRRRANVADEAFESGIVSAGDVHIRFSVHFYLLAIFFVIFDMEAVFLFAWAVALREAGWAGFIEAAVFIGVLLAALVYLWACGALDWRTRRQRLDSSKAGQ